MSEEQETYSGSCECGFETTIPEALDEHMTVCPPTGTAWTAPGEGATLRQLFARGADGADTAEKQSDLLARMNGTRNFCKRTNLRLTGAPLAVSDLENIAKCEVAK